MELNEWIRAADDAIDRELCIEAVWSTERQPGDPTPEEIAEQAAEIRRGWSPYVRRGRRAMIPWPVIPTCRVAS